MEMGVIQRDRVHDSYPAFDWLRFILASVVVLAHAGLLPAWENNANIAVQVFFALSGWLIGGILLRTERADLPRFFYNRVTRIWIPYFAAVTAIYAVAIVKDGGFDPRYLFFDATFTNNWFVHAPTEWVRMPMEGTGSHLWSISVEEQFYLAAPLVLVLARGGRSVAAWAIIAAAAWLSGGWYGSIACGVLAAVLQDRYGDWHLRFRSALWIVLAGAAPLLFVSYILAAPIFALCVVLLCARPGARHALPVFLGGISYPLYLNHWIGLFAAHAVLGHTAAAGAIGYVANVAVAAVAWLLVDRQVMKYRGGLYRPRLGLICAGSAYALLLTGIALSAVL